MTSDPKTILALPVCDCIALVLFDPVTRTLALAHLGWQASADNLVEKLITKLENSFSVETGNIIAYLSPHIRKESYFFKPPLTQQTVPSWESFLEEDKAGNIHIDLTGFNKNALQKAGVVAENIIIALEDTANPDTPFSSNFLYNKNNSSGSADRFLVSTQIPA